MRAQYFATPGAGARAVTLYLIAGPVVHSTQVAPLYAR
jgi:hypothetical protein